MSREDQEYLVQKIRTQYTEKAHTELDDLRKLDQRVKRPANRFAGIFGTAAALIMGGGMSLIMTNLGETLGMREPMLPGLCIGVAGMAMAILNYPIYQRILNSRRRKYADRIVTLSEKIINSESETKR